MRRQLTRGATLALLLGGASLLLANCSDSQALENEIVAGSAALVQHPVDLSGTWKVDTAASDDPREALGDLPRPGPRAGAPGDSAGRRSRGGRGGPAGPFGMGQRRQGLLTISQTDETVVLSHGGGRSITITPDGQTVTKEGPRGEHQVTANWEGEALVVVHTGPQGGTMTRSFQLSADGQQLIVTHKLEGGPIEDPVEFRIVFNRA